MEGFVCFIVCVLILVDSNIMWKWFKKDIVWKKDIQARVEHLESEVENFSLREVDLDLRVEAIAASLGFGKEEM